MHEKLIILDFGSQYTQLIARRVREQNVFCEIYPFNQLPKLDETVKGVIFSGSPFSVNDPKAPDAPVNLYKGKVPLLGVCYGAQFMAKHLGGRVERSLTREYVVILTKSLSFLSVKRNFNY